MDHARRAIVDLLDTVEELDLVEHVAPVQWGLRLLVTEGSRLLELDDIRPRLLPFDSAHADVSVAARRPARRSHCRPTIMRMVA